MQQIFTQTMLEIAALKLREKLPALGAARSVTIAAEVLKAALDAAPSGHGERG